MGQLVVKIWEEVVNIPTYGIGKPDKNPMFFEKRVYQGSSGVVYPYPVIEKIYDEKEDKEYKGLFLENKYLKIMVLPELGGRIQMAYDKIKERHFIYYNQVIKPALVGLTGPWISGGIEFNWPQHHRPSTFEPLDYTLSENADGSKTVWVNEIERMFGTKGMAGFTLYPDKAYLEIKAQLYNRTSLPQTFLWWANPAVKVNDDYQSVFPPDVNAVFDHGKRDVSKFPIATDTYYKVDYSPGTDISRYKNIPVPTSYMAINSDYNFVGGYEHDTQAGVLHVANHHISPGKKQWTWGHGDFGQAWDRNLTDEDGPYIELMAGVFTDNQPDFSWIMPYEEKSFTQYFLPYRELGVVKNATKDILINLEKEAGNQVCLKIFVTSEQKVNYIKLTAGNAVLLEETISLSPENVYERIITLQNDVTEDQFLLVVKAASGRELIRYEPAKNRKNEIPEPAKPALEPKDTENNEQLFLTGQHLEQYRHATYSPVPYYEEALRIDSKDFRNNNALGLWYLRKGQFAKSEPYFRKAIETSTQRNCNPYDSEPHHNLGLSLKFQGKLDEAYKIFYKSTWSSAWQDSGYFSIAQIDMARGDFQLALDHISLSLNRNACNSKAYIIKAVALKNMGCFEEVILTCTHALERDRFNLGALFEKVYALKAIGKKDEAQNYLNELLELGRGYLHNFIEYSLDYEAAGLFNEAIDLLSYADTETASPLVYYHLGHFYYQSERKEQALLYFKKAQIADPYLCFPNRLEDIKALQIASEVNPSDDKSHYYLGNLWYDKRQYSDAIQQWELSAKKNTSFPTVLRNLGIAYFNKQKDSVKALEYFKKAFELDKSDARILMELDQLYKRLNRKPETRLALLEENLETAELRDDIYLERAAIYNFIGQYDKAYNLIMNRQFHPWEGGEGKVSGQYIFSLVERAKKNIWAGNFKEAINQLEQVQVYPHNLGEGKLFGARENDIFYWIGCANEKMEEEEKAKYFWQKATVGLSEPSAAMFYNDQQPDKIFYQGLAWKKLGHNEKAKMIFEKLVDYANNHLEDEVKIDYFAVSLPDLLIFEDDLKLRNKTHCYYIMGLGYLGLNKYDDSIAAFNKVLEYDGFHFGAKAHIDLISVISSINTVHITI